jgi:hypothetical protein
MNTAKDEVKSILNKLPDGCTTEDIQYHLYVAQKVRRGLERSDIEGTVSQGEIERKFSKWTTQ